MDNWNTAVYKVTAFWAEKSFNTPCNQDNGDDSEQCRMAMDLANMLSASAASGVTDGQVAKFKDALAVLLEQYRDQGGLVEVDYHPCPMLEQAAGLAGIEDTACFPIKSFTNIQYKDGGYEVTARYQYGGKVMVL
jgi:hypothetical protein